MDEKLAKERKIFNNYVVQRNKHIFRLHGSPYRYVPPGAFQYVKVCGVVSLGAFLGGF